MKKYQVTYNDLRKVHNRDPMYSVDVTIPPLYKRWKLLKHQVTVPDLFSWLITFRHNTGLCWSRHTLCTFSQFFPSLLTDPLPDSGLTSHTLKFTSHRSLLLTSSVSLIMYTFGNLPSLVYTDVVCHVSHPSKWRYPEVVVSFFCEWVPVDAYRDTLTSVLLTNR